MENFRKFEVFLHSNSYYTQKEQWSNNIMLNKNILGGKMYEEY